MMRRWRGLACLCLLVAVATGAYYWGRDLEWSTLLPRQYGRYSPELMSYQHYWHDKLGEDVEPVYLIEYLCGHEVRLAGSQLQPELLAVSVTEMEQAVRAMQVEMRQENRVLLRGRLPVLCQECQTYYLVGEQDGYVAVFRGQTREHAVLLQRLTDMSVQRLPESVHEQLRVGIVVASEDELAYVLEGLDR